jgi:hypothetical protein
MRSIAITLQELADFFGLSRPMIQKYLRKYNLTNKTKYDPKDINSVFDFFEYLQKLYYPTSLHNARRFKPQQN